MKLINTKVHGFHDYFTWLLLLVSPWLFRFANGRAEMWIPVALGVFTLLLSLITDYEFGLFKMISMKTHLAVDIATGLFLTISPWLFGFSDRVYLPHVFIGVLQLLVAFMSQTIPYTDRPRKNFWTRKRKSHLADRPFQ